MFLPNNYSLGHIDQLSNFYNDIKKWLISNIIPTNASKVILLNLSPYPSFLLIIL